VKLELEIFGSLCATCVFKINDIQAYEDDFGVLYDDNSDEAEEYSCGDRRFTPHDATDAVLAKYGITPAEYLIVCGQLESGLSFGNCGLCS